MYAGLAQNEVLRAKGAIYDTWRNAQLRCAPARGYARFGGYDPYFGGWAVGDSLNNLYSTGGVDLSGADLGMSYSSAYGGGTFGDSSVPPVSDPAGADWADFPTTGDLWAGGGWLADASAAIGGSLYALGAAYKAEASYLSGLAEDYGLAMWRSGKPGLAPSQYLSLWNDAIDNYMTGENLQAGAGGFIMVGALNGAQLLDNYVVENYPWMSQEAQDNVCNPMWQPPNFNFVWDPTHCFGEGGWAWEPQVKPGQTRGASGTW